MKVIICGAGRVGTSIAAYLSREPHHEITIIDLDAALIAKASERYDVKGVVGHAAHPEVLVQAGIKDADILIAVTHLDEVNMVACQIAHSLFHVSKKIARLRERSYLDPSWSNLFSRNHMPIDAIISPERAVAGAIIQRLSTPGTTNNIVLEQGDVHLVGIHCPDDCPLLNTQLKQLPNLFSGLPFEIMAIFRGYEHIPITPDSQLEAGDEVYVLTGKDDVDRVRAIFGHFEEKAHSFVVIGGGNIGSRVAKSIKQHNKKHSVKLIENNAENAKSLAVDLNDLGITIIQGEGLDQAIMQEANIGNTDTVILVTNDDECNIIGGVIAKKQGCGRVISLVNKIDYSGLAYDLGLDTMINPSAITVSTILSMVRCGRIRNIHSLRDGALEVTEVEVSSHSPLLGMSQSEVAALNSHIRIGAIYRDEALLFLNDDLRIQADDHLIIAAPQSCAAEVERLFSQDAEEF